MSKFVRKSSIALLLCFLFVFVAVAGSASSADEPVEILWWWVFPETEERNEVSLYFDMYDDYNKEFGTNIQMKYEFVPYPDYAGTKLMTAFAAGDGPDVILLAPPFIPNYVNSGSLLPLTEYFTDEILADFSKGMVDIATMGGDIYTIPQRMDLLGLWYDAKLFEAEGVKVPETWDELISAAKALTTDDRYGITFRIASADPGWSTFNFYPFVWAAGGDIIDADAKKSLFDSEGVLSALQLYKDLADAGVVNIDPSRREDDLGIICDGETAMQITGSWECPTIDRYLSEGHDIDIRVIPFPVPQLGDNPASCAGGWGLAVNSATKHPQEAVDVLMWAFAKETKYSVELNTQLGFAYSPRASVVEIAGDAYRVGQRAVFTDQIYGTEKFELRLPAEGLQYIADAILDVLYGGDPAAAQAKAHEALQKWLDEFDGLI